MKTWLTKSYRQVWVVINYSALLAMNLCFYMVIDQREVSHWVDAIGITSLVIVAITFLPLHRNSGLWSLTHASVDNLDERQVHITHEALRYSYVWFTVICLIIMLVHAILYRLVPSLDLVITVPLVGSLIYLAHTLPGSVLAWTENEVPGELK